MKENYFDKFMKDQLERERRNNDRLKKLHEEIADDPKRRLLRRYRENVQHLKVWKRNA